MKTLQFTNETDLNGVQIGTLIKIIDIGMQPAQPNPTGKYPFPASNKVIFVFEIQGQKRADGNLWCIETTLRLDTTVGKELHKYAKALLGGTAEAEQQLMNAIDFSQLLGRSVQLEIGKTAKGNPRIDAVMAFPSGMPQPKPTSQLVYFDLDNPDMEIYESLKDWIKECIAKAENAPEKLKQHPTTTAQNKVLNDVETPNAIHF